MARQKNPTIPRKPSQSDKESLQHRVGKEAAKETMASAIPVGWRTFRKFYSADVIEAAEELFAEASLNIQAVLMVQAADCLRVRATLCDMTPGDPMYMMLERLAAQQLRHLRLMVERHGPNKGAGGKLVAVPLGLILPDLGDPLLLGAMDLVN